MTNDDVIMSPTYPKPIEVIGVKPIEVIYPKPIEVIGVIPARVQLTPTLRPRPPPVPVPVPTQRPPQLVYDELMDELDREDAVAARSINRRKTKRQHRARRKCGIEPPAYSNAIASSHNGGELDTPPPPYA